MGGLHYIQPPEVPVLSPSDCIDRGDSGCIAGTMLGSSAGNCLQLPVGASSIPSPLASCRAAFDIIGFPVSI